MKQEPNQRPIRTARADVLVSWHARPRNRRSGGGFTLIELIVVIVILAVLAGVIAPSLLKSEARYAELEAQAVQRLLTIAAERDSLSTEAIAIDFDESSGQMQLLVRRINTVDVASGATARDTGWQPDPLALPVVFTHSRLVSASADGRPLPRQRWRVIFTQVALRPSLAMSVEPKSTAVFAGHENGSPASWQISLAPEASAATRINSQSGKGLAVAADRSIDLDSAGKGEKAW